MAAGNVKKRRLGMELQRLREAANVSRPVAAAAIGCSQARIGHIEVGRNPPSKSDLIVLVRDTYGADADTLAVLEDLRATSGKRGWWSQYGLGEAYGWYVGLETDATSLRVLDLETIHGLLQTEAYMRRSYALDGRLGPREVEKHVQARLHRQVRLIGDNPLELTVVMSQAALERCASEESVAAGQLELLAERAAWPNIEIRVLPLAGGLHAGMAGPFSLLRFPDQLLPDAAHHEYAVGGHVIDDPAVVSQLATLFSELRSKSLGTNESLDMIRAAR